MYIVKFYLFFINRVNIFLIENMKKTTGKALENKI